jgi:DNA-binding IclR family transcriptional regulator
MVDAASGLVLFGYQPETEKALWLSHLASSSDPERLERFLADSKAAVEQGYVRSPSKFVDGVTDLCVPVIGAQGAVAALIVPFIISKPLPATVEEVLDWLHDASARIAGQLSGE